MGRLRDSTNSTVQHELPCEEKGCNLTFATAKELRAHTAQHTWGPHYQFVNPETGKVVYECVECGKRIKDRKALRKHLLIHQPRRFKCDVQGCGKAFYERTKLTRHQIVHSGEKKFECTYHGCNKRFAYRTNLKNHMRSHTGEKPYRCTVPGCGKQFAQLATRKTHSETCKQQQNLEEDQQQTNQSTTEGNLLTSTTGNGFTQQLSRTGSLASNPTSNQTTPVQTSKRTILDTMVEGTGEQQYLQSSKKMREDHTTAGMPALHLSSRGSTPPMQLQHMSQGTQVATGPMFTSIPTLSSHSCHQSSTDSMQQQRQHLHRYGLSNLPRLAIPGSSQMLNCSFSSVPTSDSNSFTMLHTPTALSPSTGQGFWAMPQHSLHRTPSFSSQSSLSTPQHALQHPTPLATPQHSFQSQSSHATPQHTMHQQHQSCATPLGTQSYTPPQPALAQPAQIQPVSKGQLQQSPLPSPSAMNGITYSAAGSQMWIQPTNNNNNFSRASTPTSLCTTGNQLCGQQLQAASPSIVGTDQTASAAGQLLALHNPGRFQSPWGQA